MSGNGSKSEKEYIVLRQVTPKGGGSSTYEPFEVLARSPLEAAETVAAEMYPSQMTGYDYKFLANTVGSFSTYEGKVQHIMRLEKLGPYPGRKAEKVGDPE